MSSSGLPSETVSLIHHIELNKNGWWRKAIGQIIQATLLRANAPLSAAQIQQAIIAETRHTIEEDRLRDICSTLQAQSLVVKIGENYKLSEKTQQQLQKEYAEYEAQQQACEKSFKESCKKHCPGLKPDEIWETFKIALVKCVKTLGANLYHLITDGNLKKDFDWFSNFLLNFKKEYHDGLNLVIYDFFRNRQSCRNQLLKLLSVYFVTEASQLSRETLNKIEESRGKQSIKVVLDTNFLFSILDLHNNPGDEPAHSLMELTKNKQSNLELKLYTLPSTIEEVKNVLSAQQKKIERIKISSPSLLHAAQRQPLTSVIKKYYEQAARNPDLTPETFFSPYINDLDAILRGKGIKILDTNHKAYSTRQDVIDDTLSEQEREAEKIKEERKRKSYEILLHDMILWHAVNDRRPGYANSTFDVEYWAVSVDWRLINFDRQKVIEKSTKFPVILHPSNLIQFIQFWVPRDEKIDDILIDSLHSSAHFNTFDAEDEEATLKILETISRYENSKDISEETAEEILSNEAIRIKLKDGNLQSSSRYTQDLIEGTILEEYNEAKKREEQANRTTEESRQKLIQAEKNITETEIQKEAINVKLIRKEYTEKFVWPPIIVGAILITLAASNLNKFEELNWVNNLDLAIICTLLLLLPLSITYFWSYRISKIETKIISEWWVFKVHHLAGYAILLALGYGGVELFSMWLARLTTNL